MSLCTGCGPWTVTAICVHQGRKLPSRAPNCNETPFDVALLDFNMPGRDGLQLAAELLAMRPSTPLAVVSANHQEEIVSRARDIGAVFLSKPLSDQAFGAFLQDAVRRLELGNA